MKVSEAREAIAEILELADCLDMYLSVLQKQYGNKPLNVLLPSEDDLLSERNRV